MPYTFNNTDGTRSTTVPDGAVDTSTYSLALVGRNVSNFGQFFAQNTVRHLENFAGPTAPTPSTILTGQLWYDKTENLLRVYDGTAWKRATNIVVGTVAPADALRPGTAFFNIVDDKLRIYDGTSFKIAGYAGEVSSAYSATTNIGSPTNYGTKLRNIFLKDSLGIDRAVLALTYVNDSANGSINRGTTTTASGRETIMAIFSDHAQFTAQNTVSASEGESINWYTELVDSDSIGATIRPGINLRREYDATALALASRSFRADAAYILNTGSPGSDSANIPASDVIHVGSSYVPSSNNAQSLGSSSFRFADLYTGVAYVGNGTTGSITPAGNITVGTSGAYVNHVYANNITVANAINLSTADLGTSGSPIQNGYFANLFVTSNVTVGSGATTYTLPNSRGTAGQTLVINGSGVVSWQTATGDIESVTAGAGLTGGGLSGAVTINVGAGAGITVGADAIAVNLSDATTFTSTNTASRAVVRDASGNFAANVITATATSARYADLAEIYISDAAYEPGTVVKLGGPAEITVTNSFADTSVFGVVSTDPAYLMNSDADGLPVALAGRVPVKVVGAVSKGQRLVSSSVPGYACAAPDGVNILSIVGRSLQDKNTDDEGVVEAVIGVK